MAENKPLKINKRLPQILLPKEKREMFANWWNSDIRFESTIPHSFEEGYLFVENPVFSDITAYKDMIKGIAKLYKLTYRQVETQLKNFMESMSTLILYFRFTSGNSMYIETYDKNYNRVSNINFTVGESGVPAKEINLYSQDEIQACENFDEVLNIFNYTNMGFLVTCLWYIATTAKTTKYVYEKKTPMVEKRHKNVVVVSDTKTINTPIYDMKKIRTVKVDTLQARKKGWTYSHSFQVHGHYRHYKNGKTIFINSFVKGKDKEFKAQQIILKPKED